MIQKVASLIIKLVRYRDKMIPTIIDSQNRPETTEDTLLTERFQISKVFDIFF